MNPKTPIIGISGSVLTERQGPMAGWERAYVNRAYVDAVLTAGGVPLIIPMNTQSMAIQVQAGLIDGLVLSGGHGVFPKHYGEDPLPASGEILEERDEFDMALIRAVHAQGKPIMGICRGMQVLNVSFGGSMFQDMSYRDSPSIKHLQATRPDRASHAIRTAESSLMRKMFGESSMVNSLHQQSVKHLPEIFSPTAWTTDGVVEAIEMGPSPRVFGVQFHPELMTSYDTAKALFKYLVDLAGARC